MSAKILASTENMPYTNWLELRKQGTPKEARIINLLIGGFALHEAARFLKMPRAAAVSCMEDFCCRARAAIG